MNILINKTIIAATVIAGLASVACKKLDRKPIVGVTSENIYNDVTKTKAALAKVYAGLTLSGQDATSYGDITFPDQGAACYFRNWWIAEEITTDEAVLAWNDGDVQQYHLMNWTPQNAYINLWYNRIFYEVAIANEFIRQTTDAKLKDRGLSESDVEKVKVFRAEARFLRALAYSHALGHFGNIPFTTETSLVGIEGPAQKSAAEVFKYIESELKDIESLVPAPHANEYGRVDQGAVWALLAKVYLNAQAQTGSAYYTEALTYCNKIISQGGYQLSSNYGNLFKTDNRNTGEIIFPLRANALNSRSYGNTTFLISASIGGSMPAASFGISGGWSGLRTTKNLFNAFADTAQDKRALFYTTNQSLEISTITNFPEGFTIRKFYTVSSTGAPSSDGGKVFSDLDFPMFRYADILLTYAEAVLRGGSGGSAGTALTYVNQLRTRAYGNNNGNITSAELTLDFMLAERSRELYWEGHRRTDLIRFGKFTNGGYVWPFKGGIAAGQDVASFRNLYPIPVSDLTANPKLKQNPGY